MVFKGVLVAVLVTCPLAASQASQSSHQQTPQTQAPAAEATSVVDGIEATATVQTVLQKVRAALGGEERLRAVTSLAIDGYRGDQDYFAYRIGLPDRFRWDNSGSLFIINGDTIEAPGGSEEGRKNARKTFVRQCLTLLLRAPSGAKVRASLVDSKAPGTLTVALTTSVGMAIFLEVDRSSYLPKAYSYAGNLEEGYCDEPPAVTAATRRVSFDEYRVVSGVRLPSTMTDTITAADGRAFPFPLAFRSVQVNAGVTPADFQK